MGDVLCATRGQELDIPSVPYIMKFKTFTLLHNELDP